MQQKNIGVFYGVGVGPGDAELITRKAERILTAVEWIFHPAGGKSGSSFVRRIVEPLGLPSEKFRPVSLCMLRDRTADQDVYRRAASEIREELYQGKSAAWITEGDPLFYSSFWHLHEELARDPAVRIQIVPGVTSTSAAAARAGIPAASLDESIAIVPAIYGLQDLQGLLRTFATIFLLKVNAVFDELLDALRKLSSPIKAVYVEGVGTLEERIVTDLESLRGKELPYFSLVILRRKEVKV